MNVFAGSRQSVARVSSPRLRIGLIALPLGVGFASIAVGRLVAHGMAGLAVAAVVALSVGLLVVARPERSLFLGIGLILLVPYTFWFGVPQADVVRLGALAALTALSLEAREAQAPIRFGAVDLAVAGFVLFSLLSWQLAPHPAHSLAAAVNFLTPIAFYPAGRRLAHKADSILWILFVGGAVASLTVYYEFFITHKPLFADKNAYLWSEGVGTIFRPGGVFGSPPAAATILAMTALCGLRFLTTATGIRRSAVWVCLAVSIGAMIVTFTRGPTIGFALGLLVFVLLEKPQRWGRYVFGAAAVTLVFALVILPRISVTSWYQQGVLRHGNLAIREVYWAQALPLINNSREHLLLGHGINSLLIGSSDLPGPVDPDIAAAPVVRTPHSQYVRTLLEEGLVGLGLLLAWLVGAAATGARSAWRRGTERSLLAVGTAAIVAALVASIVGDGLRHPPTLGVVAIITGLVVAQSQLARKNEARKP